MIQDIVSLLSYAVSNAIGMAGFLFDKTGTWPLVFAGISFVLITRFILGPILGVSFSAGASDTVSTPKPKGRGKGYKVSQGRASAADSAAMRKAGFRSGGDL